MSSAPKDDFAARLRTSLSRAKGVPPAAEAPRAVAVAAVAAPQIPGGDALQQRTQELLARVTGAPPAPAAPIDEFRDRVSTALRRARGEPAQARQVRRYPLASGESLAQVAARAAVPVDAIWNDPNNAALRAQRGSPDALLPGDQLALPADSAPATPVEAQPVGQGEYVVRTGDCMSSIAIEHGFFWETLWNDAPNKELCDARKNPNVLLAGDRVTIREKVRKDESIAPEQRHRFVRRGEPSKLVLVLRSGGKPRAGLPFRLIVGRYVYEGTTEATGRLEAPIPGNASRGRLLLGPPECCEQFELDLGHLSPRSAVDGVQSRLNNLGFDAGPADGNLGPRTIAALRAFQAKNGLPVTGQMDGATLDRLEQVHGS